MTEKTLQLDIVTPERLVFSGSIDSITAPGVDGYFQILPGHTLFISTIQIGEIQVKRGGAAEYYATSGGFVEVHYDKVSVLAETAEHSNNIDIQRAQAAKERAEQRLKSGDKTVDVDRARLSLFRALNRLRVRSRI
jgi:F-type H+-transporting ATPase subunit epsilon